MPTVSTHVLDVAAGRPARGVEVTLSRVDGADDATTVARTDAEGRIAEGLGGTVAPGLWRLTFALGSYFGEGAGCLATLDVTLVLDEDRHYHVPVLATPNSATTYLGA
jgi:5-hydroxyisourate hydrolase